MFGKHRSRIHGSKPRRSKPNQSTATYISPINAHSHNSNNIPVVGSCQPGHIKFILTIVIIFLAACNIFTLYLLHQTSKDNWSASDCNPPNDMSSSFFQFGNKQNHNIKNKNSNYQNDYNHNPNSQSQTNQHTTNQQTYSDTLNLEYKANDDENVDDDETIDTITESEIKPKDKYGHLPYVPIGNDNYKNVNKYKQFNEATSKESSSSSKPQQLPNIASEFDNIGNYEFNSLILSKLDNNIINKKNQEYNINNKKIHSIINNKNLWNINIRSNKLLSNYEYCDWTIELIFNNSLNILSNMKYHDYIPEMICSNEIKIGWRPDSYIPFIFGNQCEPYWQRDSIFLLSRLLNKQMKALDYSSSNGGASTLWISNFVKYIIGIENEKEWFDNLKNITNSLQFNNVEVRHFNLNENNYCNIKLDDDWIPLSLSDGSYQVGGIDFISIEGEKRMKCIEYALKYIKPHGGIILLDNNSDKAEKNNENNENKDSENTIDIASLNIPKHWLKFESNSLNRQIKRLTTNKWIPKSPTTIFITRDIKCND